MPKRRTDIFLCRLAGLASGALFAPAAFAQEHAAGASAGHAPEQSSLGFPQLDLSTYPSQVFWIVASFILLYALMSLVALPRVGRVIENRRAKKTGDLMRAKSAQEESVALDHSAKLVLDAAHENARAQLSAEEQALAAKIAAEEKKLADDTLRRVAQAEERIARARQEALNALSDIAADAAADMAHKVAGLHVAKADAKQAVAALLQKG